MFDRKRPVTLAALLLTGALVLPACESTKQALDNLGSGGSSSSSAEKTQDPDRFADVTLVDPVYDDETVVRVYADYRNMEDAIGYLRVKEWGLAERSFAEEIEKTSNDEQIAVASFGKGVAQEAQGNYRGALSSYKEALRRRNDTDYQDAISRVNAAIQNG